MLRTIIVLHKGPRRCSNKETETPLITVHFGGSKVNLIFVLMLLYFFLFFFWRVFLQIVYRTKLNSREACLSCVLYFWCYCLLLFFHGVKMFLHVNRFAQISYSICRYCATYGTSNGFGILFTWLDFFAILLVCIWI